VTKEEVDASLKYKDGSITGLFEMADYIGLGMLYTFLKTSMKHMANALNSARKSLSPY